MSRTYTSADITGNRYGKLTAVLYSHTGKNYMQLKNGLNHFTGERE